MRIVKCSRRTKNKLSQLPGFVYCGLRCAGFAGFADSGLSNCVGLDLRHDEAIAAYRRWLWKERAGEALKAWAAIAQLTDQSVLGCWCLNKPEAGTGSNECHCDVIARAWQWLQTQ